MSGGMPSALVTIDVDWAPDFMISSLASTLLNASVRSTWFVTHGSQAIDALRGRPDMFELGIHPNFLAGSSQGANVGQVLEYCMKLVPDAISMRSHGLMQSTPLLASVARLTSVRVDVSLFLPGVGALKPIVQHVASPALIRVPYSWEDDDEMARPKPCWDHMAHLMEPGPVIFDFHPVHVYLNSSSVDAYEQLKSRNSRLTDVTPADAEPYVNRGIGAGSMFGGLVRDLQSQPSIRVRDLVERESRRA